MRLIAAFVVLISLAFAQDRAPMIQPKVEHNKWVEQPQPIHHDEIMRSCPDGYEGHFVVEDQGFDWDGTFTNGGAFDIPYYG